jgi:L-alanine-DL-glutamate epimerase-like enolase superfamily enzyme
MLEIAEKSTRERSLADVPIVIDRVIAHPLRVEFDKPHISAKGVRTFLEMLVIEVVTRDGIVGWGEGFTRKGARSHAVFCDDVLAPLLVGQDARNCRGLWQAMRASISGKPGGQIIETMAAIDIALWDLIGKTLGQPVHRLLGGMGRTNLRAYASSVMWDDDATVEIEVHRLLALGFREIKVKIANPVPKAIDRLRMVRRLVGEDVTLYADANWAFTLGDALRVGHALADLNYRWFEEPLVPHDREGYRHLARSIPIQLASGESDYVTSDVIDRFVDRSVGVIQPDVARTGGITETWRIVEAAAAFHTSFAPHMGESGMICAAASMHLAAAAEAFMTFECMIIPNALRTDLCTSVLGEASLLVDGHLPVPVGPGLGIEVDRAALQRFRLS